MGTRLALTLALSLSLLPGAVDGPIGLLARSRAQAAPGHDTAGWTPLFDGRTTAGWRGFRKTTFPDSGWVVEDGALKSLGGKGGDIVTTTTYRDFELSWEWRLSPQGNSGVKYFVDEARGGTGGAIGHEYQMIDDDNYTAITLNARQKTGAWYDVLPPTKAAAQPIGRYNTSRLLVRGNLVEHWLNGELVLRYDITSPPAAAGIAASKFRDVAGYADKIATPILLQDHDTMVWFRNIRIRELATQ